MMCPYCNCELSDLFPFSFCPTCGQPIESRHTGQGVVRENLRGSAADPTAVSETVGFRQNV